MSADELLAVGRISVVGVGGGGGNAVNAMAEGWDSGPSLMAINTDLQALAGCATTTRLQIGAKITRGLSTGGDPKLGRLAAEDDYEAIQGLFAGMDLVFVVVTLGGGTGTGAAPVVARAAHESGALVIAFATLPFNFEGERRMTLARQGLADLREDADLVITVPNERLFEECRELTAEAAFQQADRILGMGVFAIWKLLVQRGLVNVDFAALRTVANRSGGTSTFGYGEGHGADKAATALRAVLDSPLLEHGRVLAEAESVLISIVGGPDLAFREVEALIDGVRTAARKDAHLVPGKATDERWRDGVAVTLIASERWVLDEDPRPAAAPDAAEREPLEAGKRRKGRGRSTQTQLGFEALGKGFFKDVEPTILNGEDLDIPTFIRRGAIIEK